MINPNEAELLRRADADATGERPAPYRITAPPYALHPNLPRERVADAYDFVIGSGNLALALNRHDPAVHTLEQIRALPGIVAELLERTVKDQVAAWLVITGTACIVAADLEPPPPGHRWRLDRSMYPDDSDVLGFARLLLPRAAHIIDMIDMASGAAQPSSVPDADRAAATVLTSVRELVDGTLNEVIDGREPGPVPDLGAQPVAWAAHTLAALRLRQLDGTASGLLTAEPDAPAQAAEGGEGR